MCSNYSMIDFAIQSGGVIVSIEEEEKTKNNYKLSDFMANKLAGVDPVSGGTLTPKGGTEPGGPRGLSMSHNSPFYKNNNVGYLKIYKGGSLIEAGRKKLENKERKGGGTRSKIFEFSRQSRWRFMQKIGQIKKDILPIFVTLTYPDEFPKSSMDWSNHIDKLSKRFVRRGWSAIVRKEFERRKSGTNAGRLVPHYHLLVWGAKYDDLRKYIPGAWFKIVGSENNKHFLAGSRVERLRSWRGVVFYVSKYMAKVNNEDLLSEYPEGVGRFWSVINDDLIPWAEIEIQNANDKQVLNIFRAMRRYTRAKKVFSSNRTQSILCNNPEFWGRLLE